MATEPERDYLRLPVIVTPTRVELGARCYRRHVLSDLLQLKPKGSKMDGNLVFGQLYHLGTDIFWQNVCDANGYPNGDRLQAYRAMWAIVAAAWDKQWPYVALTDRTSYMSKELLQSLLQEYAKNARLAGDLPGNWRLVNSETRFGTMPLADSELHYKVDRVVANDDGETAIVDTKTANGLGPQWVRSQELSLQQRMYAALEARRLGHVGYVLIEGVAKKGQVGLIEYVWLNQTWDDQFIDESMLLAQQIISKDKRFVTKVDGNRGLALSTALTMAHEVPFNLMDCRSYFRDCEYEPLCSSNPIMRVGLANSDYEHRYVDYGDGEMIDVERD